MEERHSQGNFQTAMFSEIVSALLKVFPLLALATGCIKSNNTEAPTGADLQVANGNCRHHMPFLLNTVLIQSMQKHCIFSQQAHDYRVVNAIRTLSVPTIGRVTVHPSTNLALLPKTGRGTF